MKKPAAFDFISEKENESRFELNELNKRASNLSNKGGNMDFNGQDDFNLQNDFNLFPDRSELECEELFA